MISVKIIGGLGNQMFQYAAGRRLAWARGASLELDVAEFWHYRVHQGFRLQHLSLPSGVRVSGQSRLGLLRSKMAQWSGKLRLKGVGRRRQRVVKERHFHFDPTVLKLEDDVYLDGYWQSPKYFADVEHVIRAEFEVRYPLLGANLEVAKQIADSRSVSLHVRRGDYVSNPATNHYHGTCSPQYYRDAEEWLRSRYGQLQLFVFSDDPDWAEANLRFSSPMRIIKHNGPERDYEDLRLMSMCRHHIIANSTFSWWAAWLCKAKDKTVIAPRRWFGGADHNTDDLIPSAWVRL